MLRYLTPLADIATPVKTPNYLKESTTHFPRRAWEVLCLKQEGLTTPPPDCVTVPLREIGQLSKCSPQILLSMLPEKWMIPMYSHDATTAYWREASERIARWLLESGIQLHEGEQQGGVAGWLNTNGRPEFVSPEATGCYLTAMEWLSAGAANSPGHVEAASRASQHAADWMVKYASNFDVPMRISLDGEREDWHNSGIFTFDLAMAARGLAATDDSAGPEEQRVALKLLTTVLGGISLGTEILASHTPSPGARTAIPDRWSTRPGPHHLKAAAAILQLPRNAAGKALNDVARQTWEHWAAVVNADSWPCQELRPLLHAVEGMLLRDGASGGPGLAGAEQLYVRLMESHNGDGLPTETVNGGMVRSDVLAQALRAGLLLRGRQCLGDPEWTLRLHQLAGALLDAVQADGGVHFSQNQRTPNNSSAIFALQALHLYSRRKDEEPVPAYAFDLLA